MGALQCDICCDRYTATNVAAALKCGHVFLHACIRQWFGRRAGAATCPACRQKCNRGRDVFCLFLPYDGLDATQTIISHQEEELAEARREVVSARRDPDPALKRTIDRQEQQLVEVRRQLAEVQEVKVDQSREMAVMEEQLSALFLEALDDSERLSDEKRRRQEAEAKLGEEEGKRGKAEAQLIQSRRDVADLVAISSSKELRLTAESQGARNGLQEANQRIYTLDEKLLQSRRDLASAKSKELRLAAGFQFSQDCLQNAQKRIDTLDDKIRRQVLGYLFLVLVLLPFTLSLFMNLKRQ